MADRWGDGTTDLVAVDPPEPARTVHATVTGWAVADRRPIVPAWCRSRHDARALAVWLARYGLHATGYHATRLPIYAARLVWRVPRGLVVAVTALVAWILDREGAPLRTAEVAARHTAEYLRLVKIRDDHIRHRALGAAAAALAAAVAVTVVVVLAPVWLQVLAAATATGVLGRVGCPPDRRIVDRATVSTSAPPRLTADVVTRALTSLGIAAMNAKGATISYTAPITRDGPGWRADVDLPHGVTVADVVERRDRLASGLRRPLSAVWPEPSAEQHAGRLILWVGDQPLNAVKPAGWPLAKTGRVDLLGGTFPFGTDQRGRPVLVSLAETNALIGSLPGGGKTAAVRVLALAAALDPIAEIRVSEHKGSGDLSALEKVAHRYVSGVSDEAIGETVASLREVHTELERRARVLGKLPRDRAPDSKVTPALAAVRTLGLHPLVMVIDEAQEVFTHPEHGDEAGRLCEAIIKRGRALAVILVLATQRPDAKSLPTGISTNVGVRYCLRVMDQTANDMILGTSSYKAGIRATTLTPRDRGIGYLVGVGDDPIVVRTYYVDRVAADAVAERARTAREVAGRLSGYALGEPGQGVDDGLTRQARLLADLTTVMAACDRMWSVDLCAALAEHDPGRYAALTVEGLAAALPVGLTTGQVWGTAPDGRGRNRRGLSRADVAAALERHHATGHPAQITA